MNLNIFCTTPFHQTLISNSEITLNSQSITLRFAQPATYSYYHAFTAHHSTQSYYTDRHQHSSISHADRHHQQIATQFSIGVQHNIRRMNKQKNQVTTCGDVLKKRSRPREEMVKKLMLVFTDMYHESASTSNLTHAHTTLQLDTRAPKGLLNHSSTTTVVN